MNINICPTTWSIRLCDEKEYHKETQLLRFPTVFVGRTCVLDCGYWDRDVSSTTNRKQNKYRTRRDREVCRIRNQTPFNRRGVLFLHWKFLAIPIWCPKPAKHIFILFIPCLTTKKVTRARPTNTLFYNLWAQLFTHLQLLIFSTK